MATCPTLSSGETFLSSLLLHIDCQGRTLGMVGYQALAQPDSIIGVTLTSLITLFIAFFGIRMALGQTPSVHGGVTAVVKIGIVLTLAASWPAYRTVVYDVIVEGPGQLSRAIGQPSGLPGANGDLITRLQTADRAIIRLTNLGTGREELASLPAAAGADPRDPLQRFPIADTPAFGWARVLFLSSTVAAFAVVRLTAGLLLALAPLFAGLVLFEKTQGLFVGWVRALVFTLLASVAVTLILGVELALFEPWLAQTIGLRRVQTVTANAPVELLVLSLAFALILFGALAILLRLAFMVHVPALAWADVRARIGSVMQPESNETPPSPPPAHAPHEASRPRALTVADAVLASQRRELSMARLSSSGPSPAPSPSSVAKLSGGDDFAIPTFGASTRRTRPRKSIAAALRDRKS